MSSIAPAITGAACPGAKRKLPVRACPKTDRLHSLTVVAPFDGRSNQGFAEPRASARGVRPEFHTRGPVAETASVRNPAVLIYAAGENAFDQVAKLHEFVELGRFSKIAVRAELPHEFPV
jgi:hypothetical protein